MRYSSASDPHSQISSGSAASALAANSDARRIAGARDSGWPRGHHRQCRRSGADDFPAPLTPRPMIRNSPIGSASTSGQNFRIIARLISATPGGMPVAVVRKESSLQEADTKCVEAAGRQAAHADHKSLSVSGSRRVVHGSRRSASPSHVLTLRAVFAWLLLITRAALQHRPGQATPDASISQVLRSVDRIS